MKQACYWGVDAAGTPYPLQDLEDWLAFSEQHADRIRVAWHEWHTAQGHLIEVSTKFFGTDGRIPVLRCMFETATFVNRSLSAQVRVETRQEAEKAHEEAIQQARERYPDPRLAEQGKV